MFLNIAEVCLHPERIDFKVLEKFKFVVNEQIDFIQSSSVNEANPGLK